MSSGYNKARKQALNMGKAAHKRGDRRLCMLDAEFAAFYAEWKARNSRRAISLGMQWYCGWDRAIVRSESNVS